MLNVYHFLASMKMSWMRRVFETDSHLKTLLFTLYPPFRKLDQYGGEYANVIMCHCKNDFWVDVMRHYKNLHGKCSPEHYGEFVSERIHYNTQITRGKKVVHLQDWLANGVVAIGHVMDDTGNFLTYEQFCEKYPQIVTNFLVYAGVIEALRDYRGKIELEVVGAD